MAIDYMSDIVSAFFATNVADEFAYQIPGEFGLPEGFGVLSLSTVSINASNDGWTLGDIVTLDTTEAPDFIVPATLKITAVNGFGVVESIAIFDPGAYRALPSNPIDVTGGSGTGLRINVDTFSGFASQRLLTFIEICHSYLDQIESTHEAKLLQEVVGRMLANIKFGAPNTPGVDPRLGRTQYIGMRYLARNILASDI